MRYSSYVLGALALAFFAACSHSSSDSSGGSTATSTDAATPNQGEAQSPAANAAASPETQGTPGQGTTINTDKGSVTIGGSVDPSKLGVPIYPGAAQNPDAYSVTSASGSGSVTQFKTSDPFDKVYDFYKSQLPSDSEKMKMASTMAMFKVENAAGDTTLVQLTAGSGFTAITITHSLKQP